MGGCRDGGNVLPFLSPFDHRRFLLRHRHLGLALGRRATLCVSRIIVHDPGFPRTDNGDAENAAVGLSL